MSNTVAGTPSATDQAVSAAIAATLTGDRALFDALDKKGRSRVKEALKARDRKARSARDIEALVTVGDALDLIEKPAPKTAPKPDSGLLLMRRIARLELAANMLRDRVAVPEGLDLVADLPAYVADESDWAAAASIALDRVTKRTKTHDVAAGVRSAFAGEPVGTVLKTSEIAKRWGVANASGRINARLYAENGCTIPGVEPVDTSDGSPQGARVTEAVPAEDEESSTE